MQTKENFRSNWSNWKRASLVMIMLVIATSQTASVKSNIAAGYAAIASCISFAVGCYIGPTDNYVCTAILGSCLTGAGIQIAACTVEENPGSRAQQACYVACLSGYQYCGEQIVLEPDIPLSESEELQMCHDMWIECKDGCP